MKKFLSIGQVVVSSLLFVATVLLFSVALVKSAALFVLVCEGVLVFLTFLVLLESVKEFKALKRQV